jgi:hypothetical protein
MQSLQDPSIVASLVDKVKSRRQDKLVDLGQNKTAFLRSLEQGVGSILQQSARL